MPTSECAIAKAVVRVWASVPPDKRVTRSSVLQQLWIRHGQSGLPYCPDAAADLIRKLELRFKDIRRLDFRPSDFCPPENARIRTVGDLCEAILDSPPV